MGLVDKILVELNLLKTLSKLKNYNSTNIKHLSPKLLLDYHRKAHMLYNAGLSRTHPNKQFINSIVDAHDVFVDEMLKRKMVHNSPLKKL